MKVIGLHNQNDVDEEAEDFRESEKTNELLAGLKRICRCSANRSTTMNPKLCRFLAYFMPGFPSPMIIFGCVVSVSSC